LLIPSDSLQDRLNMIGEFLGEINNLVVDIIDLFNNHPILGDSTKKMWISDAEEFLYYLETAWKNLHFTINEEEIYPVKESRDLLLTAKSRLAQVTRELETFNNQITRELIQSIRGKFDKCYQLIISELDVISPELQLMDFIPEIIKESKNHYKLPCSVCGEIAITFEVGKGLFDTKNSIIYSGITHSSQLKTEHSNELFSLLEEADLSKLHSFIKEHHSPEGLDAYCPECDKVYCWVHYNAYEVFDEGFYDCTYAICPQGHKRMIDD